MASLVPSYPTSANKTPHSQLLYKSFQDFEIVDVGHGNKNIPAKKSQSAQTQGNRITMRDMGDGDTIPVWISKSFQREIQEKRTRLQLSQSDVDRLCNFPKGTMNKIESEPKYPRHGGYVDCIKRLISSRLHEKFVNKF